MVGRWILLACQGVARLVLTAALLLWGSFGAYALWDNSQVLSSAADVQAELLQWKPKPAEEADSPLDNGESFAALRRINPDVCAWITMDGTGIDFPVLQGSSNASYISRDVFGNFSLAGSIFLDSRDDPAFGEGYALLYGHHMADGNMFGDLDLYKEEDFFGENRTGQLILPDRVYRLEVAACLVTGASEKYIFDPDHARGDPGGQRRFLKENALYLRETLLEGEGKLLALTTCSGEFTDARTVVLARMWEGEQEE